MKLINYFDVWNENGNTILSFTVVLNSWIKFLFELLKNKKKQRRLTFILPIETVICEPNPIFNHKIRLIWR